MDNKMPIFITGGFGCIAPNIIKYASEAISKGAISVDITVIFIAALAVFFMISGFLVLYILEAKNIKDAFYKGVAVPTLIISLASGAITEGKKDILPIQTEPVKSTDFIPSNNNESNLLALLSPSMAYADDKKINPDMGIVEFNITPKDVKKITVSMIASDGKVMGKAYSNTSNFKLNFNAGEYTAVIETDDYYKEVKMKIVSNETIKMDVALERKGIIKQFSNGIQDIIKR